MSALGGWCELDPVFTGICLLCKPIYVLLVIMIIATTKDTEMKPILRGDMGLAPRVAFFITLCNETFT